MAEQQGSSVYTSLPPCPCLSLVPKSSKGRKVERGSDDLPFEDYTPRENPSLYTCAPTAPQDPPKHEGPELDVHYSQNCLSPPDSLLRTRLWAGGGGWAAKDFHIEPTSPASRSQLKSVNEREP